jgi:hypothetical protein
MKHGTLSLLAIALAGTLPLAAHATETTSDPPGEAAAPAMDAESKAMMDAWIKAGTPGPQHEQLARHFVGDWTARQSMWMDPAAAPTVQSATSSSKAVLDGRQIRGEYSGTFMGQPFQGLSYTGYDNVTGRYTTTWTDSMSTATMIAFGDYDPATKTYTFEYDMPDPMRPTAMIPVRMTIRIDGPDRHVFEMHETHAGKESRTMQIEYARAAN